MKAYLLKKTGSTKVLQIHEVEEPNPGPDQVKVKVSHIGINYAEILSRRGQYQWAPGKPYIPGMEAYGEVVGVGGQVKKLKVGDKVITGSQYGSYAEFITVPEYLAFQGIDEFDGEQNAALLVNYMTAWVALVKMGRVQKSDTVLIHAAAGGVGTAAVQMAKAMDTIVFGTASQSYKLDLVKDLGADHAIDYSKEDFADYIKERSGGIDFVLEVVGGEVYRKSIEILNPFGRLVVIGFASISFNKWNPFTWWKTWKDAPKADVLKMAVGSYGVMGSHIGYLTANEEIAINESGEMISFIRKHGIKPVVGKVFDFDELPAAHDYMESRKSVGKIIVKI